MLKDTCRFISIIVLGLIFMACTTTKTDIIYPNTRTVNQVDDYFGTKVSDPYRW